MCAVASARTAPPCTHHARRSGAHVDGHAGSTQHTPASAPTIRPRRKRIATPFARSVAQCNKRRPNIVSYQKAPQRSRGAVRPRRTHGRLRLHASPRHACPFSRAAPRCCWRHPTPGRAAHPDTLARLPLPPPWRSRPCSDAVGAWAGRHSGAPITPVRIEAILDAERASRVRHARIDHLSAERRLQRVRVGRGRPLPVQVLQVRRRDVSLAPSLTRGRPKPKGARRGALRVCLPRARERERETSERCVGDRQKRAVLGSAAQSSPP